MYSNKLRNKVISEFFFLENWPKERLWKKNLFETKYNFKYKETDFWQTF